MTVVNQIHKKTLCRIIEMMPKGDFIASEFLPQSIMHLGAYGKKTAKRGVLANFFTPQFHTYWFHTPDEESHVRHNALSSDKIFPHPVRHRHSQYLKFKRGATLLFIIAWTIVRESFPPLRPHKDFIPLFDKGKWAFVRPI
jgi:hypothetical protein